MDKPGVIIAPVVEPIGVASEKSVILTPDERLAQLEADGAVCLNLPKRDPARQQAVARQIVECFGDVALMNAATPTMRAAVGRTLAQLGNPRGEVLDPLQMKFIEIPAGPFLMGEGKEKFTYTLPYDYWIARYPVSEAQYQVFVAVGGYGEQAY